MKRLLDVFLCHAPADQEAASAIARRLELGAEANVWLERCGAGSPPIGVVLLGACPYPPLLERKRLFRWNDNRQEALRGMEDGF